MLVANSFDLWQRDAFFSAAEEVQESADILESAYRTWVSVKRDGASSTDLDDLHRELQTALGTAKWQLEEFERAVRSSYANCRDQSSMARHQQFIVAMGSQVTRVEEALREKLSEEGRQPFRWVNLDEDERDDLAMFLSGFTATPAKSTKDETAELSCSSQIDNLCKKKDLDCAACSSSCTTGSNTLTKGLTSSRDEVVINIGQPEGVMECSAREAFVAREDVNCEADRSRSAKRTQFLPKSSSLSVLIPDVDDRSTSRMRTVEDTPKIKGSRMSNFLHFRGLDCISQSFRCYGGLNTKVHFSRRLQPSSSVRVMIILIISFFLLVPYLLQ